MASPQTIAAATDVCRKLTALGIQANTKDIKNNEWLAKIETSAGNICVYTNSKGKVSVQTHEIKDPEQRAKMVEYLALAENQMTIPATGKWTIYTDGSGKSGQCGWSAVFFQPDGSKAKEKSGNLGPQTNGQIAGEIEGAICAIRRAINTNTKEIIIRHDYEGIGYWGRNE